MDNKVIALCDLDSITAGYKYSFKYDMVSKYVQITNDRGQTYCYGSEHFRHVDTYVCIAIQDKHLIYGKEYILHPLTPKMVLVLDETGKYNPYYFDDFRTLEEIRIRKIKVLLSEA